MQEHATPLKEPPSIGTGMILIGLAALGALVASLLNPDQGFPGWWTSLQDAWRVAVRFLGFSLTVAAGITLLRHGTADVGGLGRTVALLLAGMMLSGRGWDAALALAAVCLGLLWFRHQPNREPPGTTSSTSARS